MDNLEDRNIEISSLEAAKATGPESLPDDAECIEERRIVMEVLTRVDLDLIYSAEKLLNLDNLLMHILLSGNDSDPVIECDNISLESLEKAMEIDLLHAMVKSEVKLLDSFLVTLRALIVEAHNKISAHQNLEEEFIVAKSKLHDAEETLRQSRDQILEMKMQLAKLQMTSLAFNQNENLSKDVQVSGMYLKPDLQSFEKQNILRMLQKSLGRELDLDKKLEGMRQNEEDLKLKLRLTEQLALCMEEGAEVIWGRFLEAENMAEVLMGISKEMVGRLQIVQFTLDSSSNREQQMKYKLQEYEAQLNLKITAIGKLGSQLSAERSEVTSLNASVRMLQEQLKESMSKLEEANACNEISQEHLVEMENIIESMKENIDVAESRAENAEAKINQLSEKNLELTEELNFLKDRNDNNSEQLTTVEKQLRNLEHQLQHARASSEASQEQQNMLYAAIWDMETLIDELKQKVSKAEGKMENAEEQCLILTETNVDLNKEVEFLRNKVEFLEMSLDQATVEKMASAKDINVKSNVIMNMVMQLAMERERIQEKFYALAKENKLLVEKLRKAKKDASSVTQDHSNAAETAELPSREFQNQPKESFGSASSGQNETHFANSTNHDSDSDQEIEAADMVEAGKISLNFICISICILFLSVLVAYFLNKHHAILNFLNS